MYLHINTLAVLSAQQKYANKFSERDTRGIDPSLMKCFEFTDEVKCCKQTTIDDIDISSFGIFHRKSRKELEDMGKGVNKRADCRKLYLTGKQKNSVYKINANKKEPFIV
ncbi:hypothetical protein KUTeg_023417 [Tegillarca granosa]|uniref:Uncharacterized protein n=1 Tax=Tegillarca granosa TaxID=220873 RepID=A0ABQ9E656_TEGGR|nr:hypothetical protein KUTeg_023417 [Tegillarca granosa]